MPRLIPVVGSAVGGLKKAWGGCLKGRYWLERAKDLVYLPKGRTWLELERDGWTSFALAKDRVGLLDVWLAGYLDLARDGKGGRRAPVAIGLTKVGGIGEVFGVGLLREGRGF